MAAPLRFLAAGLAAAAVATCGSPAEAGVVLVQPEVKNFVNNTAPAPKAAKAANGAAPAKKEAASKKAEESGAPGGAFESIRPLALPLALLAVGGAGFAASKADPEFAELMAGESRGRRRVCACVAFVLMLPHNLHQHVVVRSRPWVRSHSLQQHGSVVLAEEAAGMAGCSFVSAPGAPRELTIHRRLAPAPAPCPWLQASGP